MLLEDRIIRMFNNELTLFLLEGVLRTPFERVALLNWGGVGVEAYLYVRSVKKIA